MPLVCAHSPAVCVCTQPCCLCLHTNRPLVCAQNPSICVYAQTCYLSVHKTLPLVCAVCTQLYHLSVQTPPTCVCTQLCHLCLHTTLEYMTMNTKENHTLTLKYCLVSMIWNIAFARGGAHLPIVHALRPAVHPGITIWVEKIELEKKEKKKKIWLGDFLGGGGQIFFKFFKSFFFVFRRN